MNQETHKEYKNCPFKFDRSMLRLRKKVSFKINNSRAGFNL